MLAMKSTRSLLLALALLTLVGAVTPANTLAQNLTPSGSASAASGGISDCGLGPAMAMACGIGIRASVATGGSPVAVVPTALCCLAAVLLGFASAD